jgi:regulator of protease activity HflC (stomatin/prohibitin superfamily)
VVFSIITVDVGTIKVVSVFGKVQEHSYEPGLHLVVPGARAESMSVRRQMFELSGGSLDDAPAQSAQPAATPGGAPPPTTAAADAQRTLALSADRIPLAVDINFPYRLNPDLAWKVFANVGPAYELELLAPAARASTREAVAEFSWTDAITSKRTELEERLHSVFEKTVQLNLSGAGFTQQEAANAISLMPPQIRRLAPPKRLLTAVGEVLAAQEDLKRQGVLIEISEREAERRAQEGIGIKKLIEELPKEFTPDQVRALLYALADKQRADSMLKAVEKDQVKVIVMGAPGTSPGVTVPAP